MLTRKEIENSATTWAERNPGLTLPEGKPYRLIDADGLYVLVRPSGAKVFEYRYQAKGKLVPMILGTFPKMTLAEAREERDRLKQQRREGSDPRVARKTAREVQMEELHAARSRAFRAAELTAVTQRTAEASALTVQRLSELWIASDPGGWNFDTRSNVENQLANHLYPVLGDKPAHEVEPHHVLGLLVGMFKAGYIDTARRIKQRLEAMYDWGILEHKLERNPVQPLKREFTKRLGVARRTTAVERHACVDPHDKQAIAALLRAMRGYQGTPSTRTLMWLLALTAVRTHEARHATWAEFDLDKATWTIPAERMKQVGSTPRTKPHVVPLPKQAVAMLRDLKTYAKGDLVFTHPRKADRPASENAVLSVLSELGYKGRMTGHGFRTLFSTLCNEADRTNKDLVEASLAHKDPDEVRGTYNLATWVTMRRELMQWYANELERLEKGALTA
jgi:integrase